MIYVFFPYLKTNKRFSIRDVELRSTQDLEGLDSNDQEIVQTLSGVFCQHDMTPISEMTFALLPLPELVEHPLLTELKRAHLVLAYIYSVESQLFGVPLTTEKISCFAMVPRPVYLADVLPGDEQNQSFANRFKPISGFMGVRNWQSVFFVTNQSKIFPEFPNFSLPHRSQSVAADIEKILGLPENWALRDLFLSSTKMPEETIDRVFTSLRWHAASCRLATDSEESILFLTIAFESLLRLPSGPGITDKFKTAVLTLAGPVPRLDDWLDQFYDARSTTTHTGRAASLFFDAAVQKKKNKDQSPVIRQGELHQYGLRVYRICLNAIVTGAVLSAKAELAKPLIPQSERLIEICKHLKNANECSLRSLLHAEELAKDLVQFSHHPSVMSHEPTDINQVNGAVRLAFECLRKVFPDFESSTLNLLDEIATSKSLDVAQHVRLSKWERFSAQEIERQASPDKRRALIVVNHLIHYVCTAEVALQIPGFGHRQEIV